MKDTQIIKPLNISTEDFRRINELCRDAAKLPLDAVPFGWFTKYQLAEVWGCSYSEVCKRIEKSDRLFEKCKFRVKTRGMRNYPVNHYKLLPSKREG